MQSLCQASEDPAATLSLMCGQRHVQVFSHRAPARGTVLMCVCMSEIPLSGCMLAGVAKY